MVLRVVLCGVFWRAEEVSYTDCEVELAVLRVNGFDFCEEVFDGADGRTDGKTW